MSSIHAVQFYNDDVFLIDAISAFITAGRKENATNIIVATENHRDALRDALRKLGVPELAGKLMEFDASELLSTFMIDGWPNKGRFNSSVGQIVQEAARQGPVRIYGEMVALLWAQGKPRAAIHLEELWNDLTARHAFSLLCGYPNAAFPNQDNDDSFLQVCNVHTHVHPAEQSF